MKNLIIFTVILILSIISCKSQTILPLGGPPVANKQNLPKPIHIKDINNIRNTFYGVWQGTSGNNELTLYIYKIDDVSGEGLITDIFIDKIFGYYIYKENGVEIINSQNEAQLNNTSQTVKQSPFYGNPKEDEVRLWFRDYGIQIENQNGDFYTKKSYAYLTVIDNGGLNLNNSINFELKNYGEVLLSNTDYNSNFSIPTNMVLTKIANIPPPLN